MTNPDAPQLPSPPAGPAPTGSTTAADAPAAPATAPAPAGRPVRLGLASLAVTLVLCVAGYIAATVPGPWFPAATALSWGPRDVAVMRGKGALDGDALVVEPADAGGPVLVSLTTDFRSSDYRAVAWDLTDIPADADVRMLWRSDFAPAKMHSIAVTVAAGRLLPVDASAQSNWIGRIKGIALTIRAEQAQPVRLRGVTAKPMGAREVVGDRLREWLAFEGWNGTSIEGVTGGATVQSLPLPLLLAVAAAAAMAASLLVLRLRRQLVLLPMAIGAIFVMAWFIGDLRWEWNLVRQSQETGRQYAGKDWQGRHLAAEDNQLFSFIEHVRAKLPADAARVFVVAEASYFRDRGAYYLYPHNVMFDPYRDTLPLPSNLHAGDFLVVYQRRGVQYNGAEQRLRFPDGTTVAADLVLVEAGAALFLIR